MRDGKGGGYCHGVDENHIGGLRGGKKSLMVAFTSLECQRGHEGSGGMARLTSDFPAWALGDLGAFKKDFMFLEQF